MMLIEIRNLHKNIAVYLSKFSCIQIHSLQIENAEKKQAVQELTSVLSEKKAAYEEVIVCNLSISSSHNLLAIIFIRVEMIS